MYTLPYFKEKNETVVLDFIRSHPFATITGFDGEYPVTTHIPLEAEFDDNGKMILRGHMMRKTDHHLAFEKNDKVLVVFHGPQCYVSASWYSNPQSGSTWNYITVHAKGRISFTDEAGTYEAVKRVTNYFEGQGNAGSFDQLPDSYVLPMLKAIVGFRIEVDETDNVFKLSQNRDEPSFLNIIEKLRESGDHDSALIAEEMEKRRAELFGKQ